jgi:signal transduction histidine kinase
LSFGMAESGRPLDDADLLFAVELARLAALAGEAAGLFEQLATERNRLSVVIDRFQDAVVTVTPELEIELANPSAHDLLGGELLPGVSLPNPWPEVVDLPALAGSLFKPGARPIERMVTLDGNDRTLELIGLPARGDSTAVIVVRDASERERADRAEREFVANAAHELRTPLAAITAAAEALDLGAKDVPADRDRFLAHLRRECERLTRLTDSLLVLARAQSGAEPPSTERIDVPALLKGIAGGLRPRRGVDVKVRCRDGVAIEANRALVEQALRNLAQNASKFTRQGRVELTAGHSDGVVVLEVRDTGPGIPAAERERVFRRFYRTGRRSSEGFGLGLAIVRESIRAAGGTVELMSEPNRGTAVRLTFPKPAK